MFDNQLDEKRDTFETTNASVKLANFGFVLVCARNWIVLLANVSP